MKTKGVIKKELFGGVMAASLLLAGLIGISDAPVLAEKKGNASGSMAAAFHILKSCRNEAKEEYWIAIANADMLPDADDRAEARDEADEELADALEECGDQYEARLDLVEDLDEAFYDPEIYPADFASPGVNPYWPMVPGTTRTYEGETEDGTETVVVTVTGDTREILGVVCTVVQDVAYLDGDPIEDTLDYFAIDNDGNVWYFGENSVEIEDGMIVDTEGSWISGEDGAKPGIVMLADPMVDDVYRQEYLAGEAEDAGAVLSLTESVTVPYGIFEDCLQTEDFTPVEPDTLEYKFYAPGIGVIKEVDTESGEEVVLISVTP